MKTIEQQVQELTDREEIKELTARYAHSVARGEGASVAALFTDDGTFINRFPGQPVTEVHGQEDLNKFYGAIQRNTALPCIHNHLITLNGNEATGTCTIEVRINRKGQSMIGSGYYEDRFRRENGRWKFVLRDCTFFHFVPIQQGWAEGAKS
ncbi:MAG: nuclear transport factor 2 family protein [Deltaproteobacteria bacterium]|nr:nuclear transport factor 2 family protein [Deltaproteobacteria bacterium]